jgi:hypothetical protein
MRICWHQAECFNSLFPHYQLMLHFQRQAALAVTSAIARNTTYTKKNYPPS